MRNPKTKMQINKIFLIALQLFNLSLLATLSALSTTAQTSNTTPQPPETIASYKATSDDESYKYIPPTDIIKLIAEMNDVGQRGYKLLHITPLRNIKEANSVGEHVYLMKFACIMKKDAGNTYKYDWFVPGKNNLESMLKLQSSLGFYFREAINVSATEVYKESAFDDPTDRKQQAIEGNLILFEGKNEIKEAYEYEVIKDGSVLGINTPGKIEDKLDGAVLKGFRPVGILIDSRPRSLFVEYSIVLEKSTQTSQSENGNNNINPSNSQSRMPECSFVKSTFFNPLKSRIGSLSKKGFRIALVNTYSAVMCREDERATPVSYKRVDATKPEQLSEILRQGATYYTSGLSYSYLENILFFEQKTKKAPARYEYKMIKLSEGETDTTRKKNNKNQTPVISENSMSSFRMLLKEGYEIRDLVYAEGVVVVLERSR